jgi:hypothetical protein
MAIYRNLVDLERRAGASIDVERGGSFMRFGAPLFFVLSLFATSTGGQSEETDPYSIHFVQSSLRTASANPGVSVSFIQNNLQRLGDSVSIALLKILDEQDLTNPKTVEAFLPLIRQSFSYPDIISPAVNKKPNVTLFLLKYLRRSISDAKTLEDIEETMRFVHERTATAVNSPK